MSGTRRRWRWGCMRNEENRSTPLALSYKEKRETSRSIIYVERLSYLLALSNEMRKICQCLHTPPERASRLHSTSSFSVVSKGVGLPQQPPPNLRPPLPPL